MTASPEWIEKRGQLREKKAQYVSSLKEEDKLALAITWVDNLKFGLSSEHWKEADSKVHKCLSNPEMGYDIITLIWSRVTKKHDQSYIGVLIENWLALHGHDVIEKVEQFAAQDQSFRSVLKHVYKNTMPEPIYQRVRAASSGVQSA